MVDEKPLSDREKKLVAALQALGDWSTRPAIAAQLGKKKLNPVDDLLLVQLAEKGVIRVEKIDRPGIISYSLKYRAK